MSVEQKQEIAAIQKEIEHLRETIENATEEISSLEDLIIEKQLNDRT